MTDYKDYNFPLFHATRDLINARGDKAISPADMDNVLGQCDRSRQYAERDMKVIIANCTGMYMLPGWERSYGAAAEFFAARWIAKDEPGFVFETRAGIVSMQYLLYNFVLAHCSQEVIP